MMTVRDVATALHLSLETVRRMARSGELPSATVRRRRLIAAADVTAYLAARRTAA